MTAVTAKIANPAAKKPTSKFGTFGIGDLRKKGYECPQAMRSENVGNKRLREEVKPPVRTATPKPRRLTSHLAL
jgi:hypothetical protein